MKDATFKFTEEEMKEYCRLLAYDHSESFALVSKVDALAQEYEEYFRNRQKTPKNSFELKYAIGVGLIIGGLVSIFIFCPIGVISSILGIFWLFSMAMMEIL